MTNPEENRLTKIRLSMKRQKIYFWLTAGSIVAGTVSTLIIVIMLSFTPTPGKGCYWFIIPAICLVLFLIFFKQQKKEGTKLSALLKK